uniref:Uncharacterized protein n=1 Tax=Dactylella sp. TaxID=1814903 RepID=A0A482DQU3_9PEZI|nr:hypothetical protein [Dactylella sp.]
MTCFCQQCTLEKAFYLFFTLSVSVVRTVFRYFGHLSADHNRNLYGLSRFANSSCCTEPYGIALAYKFTPNHIFRQCKIHCSRDFCWRAKVWLRNYRGVSTKISFTLRGLGLHSFSSGCRQLP